MSVLDLALSFNSQLSEQAAAKGSGSVPSEKNLGQRDDGAKSLSQRDKRPVSKGWDSRDTPSAVPVGTLAAKATLGTAGTLGTAHGLYPDGWSKGIERLVSRPCPEAETGERWACACRGVQQFAREWAAKAMSLGWTFDELFALREPFANVSLQGAAWFIGGSTVTAVTADAITLRSAGGSTTRIYRKSEPGEGELMAAVEFLEVELADGAWHNSINIEAKADAVGITIENLARARHKLGVESRQWPGTPRKWRLPDGEASQ